MVVTRVGPLSVAKIAGILYIVIGLIAGAILSLVAMAGFMGNQGGENNYLGPLFGLGAVILLPVCYGIFGFVGALIMTSLFNVVASLVGGVELDVK